MFGNPNTPTRLKVADAIERSAIRERLVYNYIGMRRCGRKEIADAIRNQIQRLKGGK